MRWPWALLLAAACSAPSATQTLNGPPSPTPTRPSAQTSTPRATHTSDPSPIATTGSATATAVTASPTVTHRPTASPTPQPPPGTTVLTDADSGRTIAVAHGARIEVRLSQDSYDPPAASDPGVLQRRSSTGGYPSSDPVDAVFAALHAGQADLSASSDYACFHTSPQCYRPSRLWSVHVVVS